MVLTRRMRIGIVFGLLSLAVVSWVNWSFMTGSEQMQRFCASFTAGSSVAQIRAQAEQLGYRVSTPVDGRAFVHDSGSFGRFTCDLQFKSNRLMSATYLLND